MAFASLLPPMFRAMNILLGLATVAAMGCYSPHAAGPLDFDPFHRLTAEPRHPAPAIESGPAFDAKLKLRSYVLAAAPTASSGANLRNQPPLPWYASRLDQRPAVWAGYELPTYQNSTTYTIDHQHTFGNRVYDHYRRSTYRHRVQNAVR